MVDLDRVRVVGCLELLRCEIDCRELGRAEEREVAGLGQNGADQQRVVRRAGLLGDRSRVVRRDRGVSTGVTAAARRVGGLEPSSKSKENPVRSLVAIALARGSAPLSELGNVRFSEVARACPTSELGRASARRVMEAPCPQILHASASSGAVSGQAAFSAA